jgi:hypothetical protein
MTNPQPHPRRPTTSQLSLLKELAMERGQSFAYPQTFAEAGAQIKRLMARKPTRRSERRREIRQVHQDFAERRGGSAAVRPSEIRGYGSSATWR